MVRRVRRYQAVLGVTALVAVVGAGIWAVNYGGWKQELRAAGFVADMAAPSDGDRVLVVAPHPDAATLGCAGLLQESGIRRTSFPFSSPANS